MPSDTSTSSRISTLDEDSSLASLYGLQFKCVQSRRGMDATRKCNSWNREGAASDQRPSMRRLERTTASVPSSHVWCRKAFSFFKSSMGAIQQRSVISPSPRLPLDVWLSQAPVGLLQNMSMFRVLRPHRAKSGSHLTRSGSDASTRKHLLRLQASSVTNSGLSRSRRILVKMWRTVVVVKFRQLRKHGHDAPALLISTF